MIHQFYVGDRVRIEHEMAVPGLQSPFDGKIGTVADIRPSNNYPYTVKVDGMNVNVVCHEITPLERKE